MSKCTWVRCENEAVHEQLDKNEKVWAILCDAHLKLFNAAMESGDTKMVVSTWIKAQGGANTAKERVFKCRPTKLGEKF